MSSTVEAILRDKVALIEPELKAAGKQSLIKLSPKDDALRIWNCTMIGPENTPYQHGKYHITLSLTDQFTMALPMVHFTNPPYSCNINDNGKISLFIWSALLDFLSPFCIIKFIIYLYDEIFYNLGRDNINNPNRMELLQSNPSQFMYQASLYNKLHANGDDAVYFDVPQMQSDENYEQYVKVITDVIHGAYMVPIELILSELIPFYGNKRVYRGLSNVLFMNDDINKMDGDGQTFQIKVKGLNVWRWHLFLIDVKPQMTIKRVKELINQQKELSVQQQILIHIDGYRILNDNKLISDFRFDPTDQHKLKNIVLLHYVHQT